MRATPSSGARSKRLLALMLASALAPAAAADEIANLIRVEGRIPITRYATDVVVTAWQRGGVVLNGSIFSQDGVDTGGDSSATMELGDGSLWQVGRNTSFTVAELDVSTLPGQTPGRKAIERNIHILAGTVEFRIAPNERVATIVRTPGGGYLTPASTRFVVSVDPASGAVEVVIVAGEVDFYHLESGLHIGLGAGSAVSLTVRPGELAISIPERIDRLSDELPASPATLVIELQDRQLSADAGTAFSLRIEPDGDLILSVEGGAVTVAEGGQQTVVQAGDPPLAVGPPFLYPPIPPGPPPPPPRPRASPISR